MERRTPPPGPLLPPLATAAAIVSVAGAAGLANCAVLAALLRRSRNGLFRIIAQLAVADLLLVASIAPEIWTTNAGTWSFGSRVCTAYQGFSVLASTASMYFVAAVALHIIATVTKEEKALERRKTKNCQEDEDDEIKSSQHSLVANSDSSTPPRTMNLDYRVANTRVPVTLPVIFVWTLSTSLSVPEFLLAETLPAGKEVTVCMLVSNHLIYIYSLLTIFVIILPIFIICTASVLLVIKLNSKILLNFKNSELVAAIRLSLCLIIMLGVLGGPRFVIRIYSAYWATANSGVSTEQTYTTPIVNLMCSCIYLMSTLIRPLLYVMFLPKLRKIFSLYEINLGNV